MNATVKSTISERIFLTRLDFSETFNILSMTFSLIKIKMMMIYNINPVTNIRHSFFNVATPVSGLDSYIPVQYNDLQI